MGTHKHKTETELEQVDYSKQECGCGRFRIDGKGKWIMPVCPKCNQSHSPYRNCKSALGGPRRRQ